MVATAIAKPVERINGLTSISDRDQVGAKTITVRGDCLKCSSEFLPLIDAEGARDLAKRSPFVIKKSVKKGKKGTKKTFKTFKKGGKKTFKKTKVPPFNKPFKKGSKKTFHTIDIEAMGNRYDKALVNLLAYNSTFVEPPSKSSHLG